METFMQPCCRCRGAGGAIRKAAVHVTYNEEHLWFRLTNCLRGSSAGAAKRKAEEVVVRAPPRQGRTANNHKTEGWRGRGAPRGKWFGV